jgi:hypothetical protein
VTALLPLRWILGTLAGAGAVGYLALVLLADGFRRSFGASPNAAWKVVVPLAVCALLCASVLLPGQRALLHVTLVVVMALLAGSLWLFREAPLVSLGGMCYAVTWLLYYLQAIRR